MKFYIALTLLATLFILGLVQGNSRGSSKRSISARQDDGGSPNSVTQAQFDKGVTSNGYQQPTKEQWRGYQKYVKKSVKSKREAAMALAQFIHETGGLIHKRELACQNNNGCGNTYATANCDAPNQKYFGRGYIQLSYCPNYEAASKDLGRGDELVRKPDLVASNDELSWATAFWFWKERVSGARGVQQGQFGATTKAINGQSVECNGQNVESSKNRFKIYQNVFKAFQLPGKPNERGCYN